MNNRKVEKIESISKNMQPAINKDSSKKGSNSNLNYDHIQKNANKELELKLEKEKEENDKLREKQKKSSNFFKELYKVQRKPINISNNVKINNPKNEERDK